MMRLRVEALCLATAAALGGLGCATASSTGAISMRVDSNLPDASIWVDDVLVGNVADWTKDGRHIRSGFHRIEIRHSGYYSVFQEVELPGGAHTVVKAQLHPLVD
jgi:PEGA domain